MRWRRSRKIFQSVLALVLSLLAFSTAAAQVTNPSFESGNLTGWTIRGDAAVQTSTLGVNPADGTSVAFMATLTDGFVNPAVPVGKGATAALVESALKITPGTLLGAGNGTPILCSSISQDITLQAGQLLTVKWSLLTNQTYDNGTSSSRAPDLQNNDFAFATLVDPAHATHFTKLGDMTYGYHAAPNTPAGFTTAFGITPATCPFMAATQYHTFKFSAPTTGTYTLGFGIVHASKATQDNGVNSALVVDDIQINTDLSKVLALPAAVVGGQNSTGAVVLTTPVPGASPISVALSTDLPVATVPATLSMQTSDGLSKQFPINTIPVDTALTVTITAKLGSTTKTTTLMVNPPTMDDFHLSPTTIVGAPGHISNGVIHLSGPAGPSGLQVFLTSDSAAATVPASVTIPAGVQGKSFQINTAKVNSNTVAHIKATLASQILSAALTITP